MPVKLGIDPYSQRYMREMNSFYLNLWEHLDILPSLPEEKGEEVISYLLRIACQSTHIGNIQLGRDTLAAISRDWLGERIHDIAVRTLNFNDDWEFRRLAEIYQMLDGRLLTNLCQLGKQSENPAIQEVATDFSTK